MNQEQLRVAEPGFSTGTICTDSNLYRCDDDIFQIIEYVAAGQPFPNAPFGNGKGKTVWRKVTLATDGTRKNFNGLKVSA
ncbi:MAG TPA: hypothetical protein VJM50_19190 [Pyrinomonadaceae bacterium]|nr:hypothetical protein [Pyrinomonadaceae bacterium]